MGPLAVAAVAAGAAALAALSASGPGAAGSSVAASAAPSDSGLGAPANVRTLVLGGGCFWCLEPLFEMVKGVTAVEVGYAGGDSPNVTYQQVLTGLTGHAEVVKVTFDPDKVSAEDILTIFFTMHDPTTKNRQGNDVGPQYRSVIFYANEDERALGERVIRAIDEAKIWPRPVVTTLEPLRNYTRAEEYHQDYFRRFESASLMERSRMNAGYCQVVIAPKVVKFREKFRHLLRSE
ncbi:MAG: peptide-methionine (S)-S-oxide reductase MsrA [Fimbriimonadaceae bacterium]